MRTRISNLHVMDLMFHWTPDINTRETWRSRQAGRVKLLSFRVQLFAQHLSDLLLYGNLSFKLQNTLWHFKSMLRELATSYYTNSLQSHKEKCIYAFITRWMHTARFLISELYLQSCVKRLLICTRRSYELITLYLPFIYAFNILSHSFLSPTFLSCL